MITIRITRLSQCQVDSETGDVLIVGNDEDQSYRITFGDRDCAEEFLDNSVDALCCFHAAELRERTYQLTELR